MSIIISEMSKLLSVKKLQTMPLPPPHEQADREGPIKLLCE